MDGESCMKGFIKYIYVIVILGLLVNKSYAVDINELNWEYGPTKSSIGSKAKIVIPEGYVFLGKKDTAKFMELSENIPSGKQYMFAPEDLSWFAVFEFDSVGYVEDDEELDTNSILETLKRGTEQGNTARRENGWGTMSIKGWEFKPRYDKQNNLLEWAIIAINDTDNSEIINYKTRILGRSGVMKVVLVADPLELTSSVNSFKSALVGYDFVDGEKYSEFKKGDRMAEFGLAALVAGGAAALATKKGFWAAIVAGALAAKKIIGIVIFGVFIWLFSFIKKGVLSLFRRK